MISNKEAIRIAKEYVAGVYADSSVADIRLEEIEKASDSSHWLVTVSIVFKGDQPKGHMALFGNERRHLKVVQIQEDSGHVVAMRNRAA